jgi:putative membrane protein insertion efficiency factor
MNNLTFTLISNLISKYQRYFSAGRPQKCKYYPSCSNYSLLAIEEFGVKGLFMSAWRLIRCNPFSNGGVDYPSDVSRVKLKERLMA